MKKAYILLVALLIVSVFMLLLAPNVYSARYCMSSFGVFVVAMGITLYNNVRHYKTLIIFELLFSLSFLFMNYVYPVYLYQVNPYFSLFAFAFNEDIMTKCTALATVGYVAFCVGIFGGENLKHEKQVKSTFRLRPLNFIDCCILSFLFLTFLYTNLDALRQGYTMEGSGGGFFFIFALFYIYQYFAFSIKKAHRGVVIYFWCLISLYILTSLVLGNRGEPLYLAIAILFCYHTYVKHISFSKLAIMAVGGLFIFYFVGKTRISSNQMDTTSRDERIDSWEAEEDVLMYASELIINNRSLFALVDHTDSKGYTYGLTWSSNFFSIVPFGQSFALYVLGIKPEDFSTTKLNTSLVFSEGDSDKFGLGTNLIGDIYVSFGSIGVLLLMFLFGRFVKNTYNRNLQGPSYSQMLYVILMVLSIYYPRASLFSPLQMAAWTYVLCYISKVKKDENYSLYSRRRLSV